MIFFVRPRIFWDTHDPGEDRFFGYSLPHEVIVEEKEIEKKVPKEQQEIVKRIVGKVVGSKETSSPYVIDLEDNGYRFIADLLDQLATIERWHDLLTTYADLIDKELSRQAREKLERQQAELEYQSKIFQAVIADDELMFICLCQ